jgi:hypothetical protein
MNLGHGLNISSVAVSQSVLRGGKLALPRLNFFFLFYPTPNLLM